MYTCKVEAKDIFNAKNILNNTSNSKKNKSFKYKKIIIIISFMLLYIAIPYKIYNNSGIHIILESLCIVAFILISENFIKKAEIIRRYMYLIDEFTCCFDKNTFYLKAKKKTLKINLEIAELYYCENYSVIDDKGFKIIIVNNNFEEYSKITELLKSKVAGVIDYEI